MRILIAVISLALASNAFGHSGGVDKCGGHKDKKAGGYHVHDVEKYCACNPSAAECKKAAPSDPKASKAGTTK